MRNIARPDEGKAAAVAAGVPAALVALAREAAVRSSADAAQYVAWAMAGLSGNARNSIAAAEEAQNQLLAAGAAPALVALAGEASVQGSAGAAQYVAWAMTNLGWHRPGREALLTHGAAAALEALAAEPAVRASKSAAEKVDEARGKLGCAGTKRLEY